MLTNLTSTLELQMGGTAGWIALNAAQTNNLLSSMSAGWSSDSLLSDHRVPVGHELLWEDVRSQYAAHDVVLKTENAVVVINQERRDIRCTAYAATSDEAAGWIEKVKEALPTAERQEKLLDVTFWYSTAHGPRSYDRQLQAPSWKDIEANYPATTRERLVSLQSVDLTEGSGKLILWQGEPGTGKTFALRALGEEWAKWCRIHYVLDPEKFFTEGDYLLSVILGGDLMPSTPQSTQEQWRLIVESQGSLQP